MSTSMVVGSLASKIAVLSKTLQNEPHSLFIEYKAGQEDVGGIHGTEEAQRINAALISRGLNDDARVDLAVEIFKLWNSGFSTKEKTMEAEETFGTTYSLHGRKVLAFSFVRRAGMSILYQFRVWYGLPYMIGEVQVDSMGNNLLLDISAREEHIPSRALIQRFISIVNERQRNYQEIKTPFEGTSLWLNCQKTRW